jgi:hypothetical protein
VNENECLLDNRREQMEKEIAFRHDKREKKFAKWSILLLTCILTVFCLITASTAFGQCGDGLTLSPLSKTLTVGETHQLIATFCLRRMPQTGKQVDFQIIGPNSASSSSAYTDQEGIAYFNYTGNQEGVDTITAIFFSFESEKATATWTQQSESLNIETGPSKLNVNSQGVLPMIVFGTEDFDVQMIDPSSLLLNGAVPPLRHAYEDGASKSGEPDGFIDLYLKFDIQEIVETLGVTLNDGDPATLVLTGKLYDEKTATQTARTATSIRAVQKVMIVKKGKEKKGK